MFVSLLPSPSPLIIVFCRFGGYCSPNYFNDTWSFNTSTRKWTELQCTGSIPSPRAGHAAALVDDVMYVFGGFKDKSHLGDLIALQLSSERFSVLNRYLLHVRNAAQRWTAFQDIGPNPCGRGGHAMASDGRRVFVLGGELSPDAQADEAKLIHVFDTSMYFLFVISFPQPSSLKQSSLFTRNLNLTLTMSSIVRRPPNLGRSYPRVTRPRVNHRAGYPLQQMLEQRTVLFLSKWLPLKT
jgi:hypothetical protein